MKYSVRLILFILLPFLFSCNEDHKPITSPEPDPVAFKRVPDTGLVGWRGNTANLAVYHDRLYYSNQHSPGFITADGEHRQYVLNNYNLDMGQVITEDFLIGPLRNLRTLQFNTTKDHSSALAGRFDITTIPGVPADAILSIGETFKLNFSLNDEYFLFSYESSAGSNSLIVKLKIKDDSASGRYLAPSNEGQVIEVIPIDFSVEGNDRSLVVQRVFPYRDGWVGTATLGSLRVALKISKNGTARIVPMNYENNYNTMSFLSMAYAPSGELYVTTDEGDILYSQNGDIDKLVYIGYTNQWVRLRFINNRLVGFLGSDAIIEIVDFEDPENMAARELENIGLEDLLIRDLAYFHGQVYIATNAGLFIKNLEDFWEDKVIPTDQMESLFERLK